MAKSKTPYAGKEKRKNGKLPVPPPKSAQQAASAAPEDKKVTHAPRGSVAIASMGERGAFAHDLAIAARESAVDQGVIAPAKTPAKTKAKANVWVDGVQVAGDPGPLPESLKVENRKPLGKGEQATTDKATSAKTADTHQKELRDAQKAHKADKAKAKRVAKKEKAEAVTKGATGAMPAQGKDALKLIAGKKTPTGATAAAAKKAVIADKARPKGEQTRLRALKTAKAAKATSAAPAAKKRASGLRKAANGQSKLARIGALLRRKGGCTRAEVLELTGWPSVSIQQQAAALGVKLRTEKKPGDVTHYFAS